jgi:Uri superfamily endonuclease
MDKGAYCLVMRLKEEKQIPIGKKPPVKFLSGYYCYVGSAMNSLEKRICRHKSREKALHWHIDWLLEHAEIVDVKKAENENKVECGLSQDIASLSDKAVKKFGCSDCRCETHLHHFKSDPSEKIDDLVRKWKT